ncbi:MAG: cytochrome c biogenesis CcdA family protein [Candidatus Rokuibacteriota bacterium]
MSVSLIVAASAGLLSFLSPCVLPLVPSYLAFVSGSSLGTLRQPGRAARRALVLNALGFIVGFSLVFVAMGAGVTLLGGWLLSYRGLVQRPGGVLIILFGLYLIGFLRVPLLMRQARFPLSSKPAGLLGSVAVGAVFGAGRPPPTRGSRCAAG